MTLRSAACLLLGLAGPLAAQAPPEGRHPAYGERHGGRLFISPMGEPFRDAPDNAVAWFAAADIDHDGRITLAEFRADAMRFFALLDSDHDREIGPEEIERYEQMIAPETGSGGGSGGDGDGDRPAGAKPDQGGGRHGGHGGGGHGGGMGGPPPSDRGEEGGSARPAGPAFDPTKQGAARFSYLALPEPVIAADADFNRGVSQQEFLQAASRRFALLDANHDGMITADELPKLGNEAPDGHGRHRPTPPAGQ